MELRQNYKIYRMKEYLFKILIFKNLENLKINI